MRSERWWWLAAFCFVSLCIHLVIGWKSPSFTLTYAPPPMAEIEVALEPPSPGQKPEAKPEPEPKPKPVAAPKPQPDRKPEPDRPSRQTPDAAVAKIANKATPAARVSTINEPRPAAPEPEPGGVDLTREKKPLPLGRPLPSPARIPAPEALPDTPDTSRVATAPPLLPRREAAAGGSVMRMENPLAGLKPSEEKPVVPDNAGSPSLRIARADNLAGGGAPAPGPIPGGRDGQAAPEAPPEDIVFSGGGAGGTKLPRVAPRLGGGGGRSVLSANNPLAKDAIPEDRPGLGPGRGGGLGAGAGGGAGYARGTGIGTDPNGKVALGTLRRKPGSGIGAGTGAGIGTRSPGGGRGAGAELPGTGGTGFGSGRGSGVGVGDGFRPGMGSGGVARGGAAGGGRVALNRGIPFGDITGILRGDPRGGGGTGGGPGGTGRGAGGGGGGGADAPVHMVYVLDVSTSMQRSSGGGRMIDRAQEALKKALSELKPKDTFNIVTFHGDVDIFSSSMVPASPENIAQATVHVDTVVLGQRTNISRALERALAFDKITHIFLLSDGEPTFGIEDFDELRDMVRERNRRKVQISTLALGLGDRFKGMELLRGLAEDNSGTFNYVNLARGFTRRPRERYFRIFPPF